MCKQPLAASETYPRQVKCDEISYSGERAVDAVAARNEEERQLIVVNRDRQGKSAPPAENSLRKNKRNKWKRAQKATAKKFRTRED